MHYWRSWVNQCISNSIMVLSKRAICTKSSNVPSVRTGVQRRTSTKKKRTSAHAAAWKAPKLQADLPFWVSPKHCVTLLSAQTVKSFIFWIYMNCPQINENISTELITQTEKLRSRCRNDSLKDLSGHKILTRKWIIGYQKKGCYLNTEWAKYIIILTQKGATTK